MLKKWYVITFVVILSLLGFVSQEQNVIPNQEIVLQFTDIEITSQEAQSTIAIVKKQLQNIGADNIQVKESHNGKLKITYYSSTDIAIIKDAFSKDESLNVNYSSEKQDGNSTKLPSDENTSLSYNLDVYEIQKEQDTNRDLNGIQLVEFDSKSDRFFDPNTFFSSKSLDSRIANSRVKVAYIIHSNIAIAIDNTSKSIPEVRAGPIC